MIKTTLTILIISALLFVILSYKYKDYKKRRKLQKQFKRGNELEKEARYFLENKGYNILEEQYVHYHEYKVNGETHQSKLIIDYVVSRDNKTYLVEVKTGEKAISISDKNTRRQILEYYFAIDNDGVFLLDMENEELLKIEFTVKDSKPTNNLAWIIATAMTVLLLICLLTSIII